MRRRARRSAQPLDRTNLFSKMASSSLEIPFDPVELERQQGRTAPNGEGGCSNMSIDRASEINRKAGRGGGLQLVEARVQAPSAVVRAVKVGALAPLLHRRHSRSQLLPMQPS